MHTMFDKYAARALWLIAVALATWLLHLYRWQGVTDERVAALEIAGNGYINVRLDRGYYAAGLLGGGEAARAAAGEPLFANPRNAAFASLNSSLMIAPFAS